MPDVVVVGSLNLDLVVRVGRLPQPGETVSGAAVERRPGGKGANQAVAAARLGAHVCLVGRIGDDESGTDLRSAVAATGVDVADVRVLDGSSTGTAFITVQHGGENTIVVAPGANGAMTPEVLGGDEGLRSLLGGSGALLLQLEIPVATCVAAAEVARALGVPVVLNAAPCPPERPGDLAGLLQLVDVLIVNETEAVALAGSADPAALRALGPSVAVVTLGSRGASAHVAVQQIDIPGFTVESVDAVGAGDAFCGQFVVAYVGMAPLDKVLRRACAAGAVATTSREAQIPGRSAAEVEALLSHAV